MLLIHAVGVSKLRDDTSVDLINISNPYIIRDNMSEILGSGSFRTFLIDKLHNMNDEKINKYVKLYRCDIK